MNSVSREDREESLRSVIRDVLVDPDFNPLSVSVAHIRRPGGPNDDIWIDTGICEVHILGLTTPLEAARYHDVTEETEGLVDPESVDLDQVEEASETPPAT